MHRLSSLSLRAVALGALLAASLPTAQAAQESIFGKWNRDDGLGGIRIGPCGAALCGHVIWLKDRNGPGRIGERVFYDMHPASAGNWTGRAHNPADGKDYAGTMVLSGDHLTTSGCILNGLICKSLGLSARPLRMGVTGAVAADGRVGRPWKHLSRSVPRWWGKARERRSRSLRSHHGSSHMPPMRSVSSMIASALIAMVVSSLGAGAAGAETSVERGSYLVNAVAACATCHTPRSPPGPLLSGGNSFKVGAVAVLAPNITPDTDTGIGAWSDAQIVAAIRNDVKPDGSRIGPPMPQRAFAAISDADAAAIVAYLRTVAPVHHKVETGPVTAHAPPREAKLSVPAPDLTTAADRGRYLVDGPAHCVECHAVGAERPGMSPRVFKGPWGSVMAPVLSPHS